MGNGSNCGSLLSLPDHRKIYSLVFYDEFSVSERPTVFYAWAIKNTRPEIPSNEKNRQRCNGLLAVDAVTGEEYLRLADRARAEEVAEYLTELTKDCQQQGYQKLTVILDNCKTHKKKMRTLLSEALKTEASESTIAVEFLDLPSDSPDFNLAEYVIHQIRLRILHHQPIGSALAQIRTRLEQHSQRQRLMSSAQIQNTLQHIWRLAS